MSLLVNYLGQLWLKLKRMHAVNIYSSPEKAEIEQQQRGRAFELWTSELVLERCMTFISGGWALTN